MLKYELSYKVLFNGDVYDETVTVDVDYNIPCSASDSEAVKKACALTNSKKVEIVNVDFYNDFTEKYEYLYYY